MYFGSLSRHLSNRCVIYAPAGRFWFFGSPVRHVSSRCVIYVPACRVDIRWFTIQTFVKQKCDMCLHAVAGTLIHYPDICQTDV
ncbi:hypothetical protein DPMN_135884 [Dreissena polymorpha]|uniref:Uncharacterized protein n=1 Tax=Dreissena polymorpha TaxID=45954 RepID=A0A9D4G1R5_DREPO|nr:hypothetical protein DPMN_135884 [Dreissena polymorpha]